MKSLAWWAGGAALVVVGSLGTAACSASNGSRSDSGAVAPASAGTGSLERDRAADGYSTADDSTAGAHGASAFAPTEVDPIASRPLADRQVIRTASLTVKVRDADAALVDARAAVTAAGGYLESSSGALDARPTIHATFRVPPEEFDHVIDALVRSGKVLGRRIATDDVTGKVVDLQARVDAARTSADRLRDLLAHAGNVGDLLSVERELATREAEVDSLTGQLAAVRQQVDFSTITAHFEQAAKKAATSTAAEPAGFGSGLGTGWDAFVTAGRGVLAATGFALPFLIVVVPAGALVGFAATHRRRRPSPA
jgi:hypothetical protein